MTANKLRASLVAALLASAALTAAPAFAAPKLGNKVNNDLANAQKAQKAGDAAAMKENLDKAAADASSDYDKYMAAFIYANLAAQTNDMATAGVQAELAADSAYLASPDAVPADKANGYRFGLILALNNKHYDKAKVYAKGLEATNPTDPTLINTMIQAYALGGDSASAKALVNKRIAAMGGKPDRASLQAMLSINVADKDEAGAEETLEKIVANFGDPKDWSQLIDVAISTKGLRDVELVWLGRLMFVTGSTTSAQDLRLVGDTASHLAFYGDALLAQQHGGRILPIPPPRRMPTRRPSRPRSPRCRSRMATMPPSWPKPFIPMACMRKPNRPPMPPWPRAACRMRPKPPWCWARRWQPRASMTTPLPPSARSRAVVPPRRASRAFGSTM